MTEVRKVDIAQQLEVKEKEKPEPTNYRTYKYRWIILVLYFLVSFSSAFQWPMYVIVDNVLEKFYGTTLETVNFTATVFLLCYVVFIYPATYLLQKFGLRFAVTVAAVGPCIAALIKLLSASPDRFWVVLFAQAIIGTTQTYVTVLPASVAAAWFGPNQVSTACSIASAGIQVAVAAGCLVPSLLLDGEFNTDFVETTLGRLNIAVAIFSSLVLILTVLFFQAEPPTPPSESRLKLLNAKVNVTNSIKEISKNVPFIWFWLSYSAQVGVFYTLCFLVNPTVMKYYPNNITDVGAIGLLFMIVGVIGAAMFGVILDKFRRFKETVVVGSVLSSITMIAYSLTLFRGIAYVYVVQTLVGFFMTAAFTVGLEIGAEITYPLPENISSGFLLIGGKIFGFIFTTLFSSLFGNGYDMSTYFGMSGIVVATTILTAFVPFDLKRQAALSPSKTNENI